MINIEIKSSKDVKIPQDVFSQIIGQDKAVLYAKIAAKQRRHLLLAGPPGVGKSLIAKAIATILPKPSEQISVLPNHQRPERPILLIERDIEKKNYPIIKKVEFQDLPLDVAVQLGVKCRECGKLSKPSLEFCPYCGVRKYRSLVSDIVPIEKKVKKVITREKEIHEYYIENDEVYVSIKPLDDSPNRSKKILVPFNRSTFVQLVGYNEAELLGDVEHDPYGGYTEYGVPPHQRVVAGAVHEAHQGVLYIDELSVLSPYLQRALLTAMQEKKYSISGKNATSTGAIVKVEDVPCDFVLVGAINVLDIENIHPALRNRIVGNGYEVLLKTWMEYTPENVFKIYQFVAQEIEKDGKIPHANINALNYFVKIAVRMAREYDGVRGLTLRLRKLGGIVRTAGDLAMLEGADMIEEKHAKEADVMSRSIEEQLSEMSGGNWWVQSNLDRGTARIKRIDIR